ncbi:MAG: hypothetical protein SGI98_03975 [Verrucomicrobiota bacterium]|nr:hypothetical protein [Verrucomicrobiota bacterium]
MSDSSTPPIPNQKKQAKKPKGFLNPHLVRAVSFYVITGCVIFCVLVSILRIWDFTRGEVLWRLISTFIVVGVGTAIFTFVNEAFGTSDDDHS